jgi:succinyl-CoA synthetase beta subunit
MLTIAEGGIYSEIRKDSKTLCLPIDENEALQGLKSLRIWPILNGYRNQKKMPIKQILSAIMKIQKYAIENSEKIVELEINPLLVKENKVVVGDALLIIDN